MASLGNLPWRYRPARRFTALFVGLCLYGIGMSLMISAKLGLDPWDVFHQGMARLTGASFGTVVIAVGVVVLLFWIPLRQRPGFGTIANAIVIGVVVDAVNDVLPTPHTLWLRWAYALVGIVATGVASGLYIGARLGPGPRDGLMTGLATKWSGRWYGQIRVVRTAIEVTVLAIGWLMGGTVGWVTLLFAVSIGPLAHVMIPLLSVPDPATDATVKARVAVPDPAPVVEAVEATAA
ncbi:MAG TPA: hypothetical protein VFR11_06395 [Micromonosporaceae bacterium]|jgi:uncharacterized membrane protein YczE|nr:hypothetical protein [Micromonosporaceae bacterium]